MNRKVVIALLVLSLSFLLIQGEETSSPEVDVDRQENGAESAMGLDPGQAARNEVDQMILKADKIRGIEKDGNVEFKGIISHRELKNAIQLYRKALDLAQSTEYNTSVSYIYNSLGEIAYVI